MRTAKKPDLIYPQAYLKSELDSPIKREYVDGHVYTKADIVARAADLYVKSMTD